MRVKHLIEELNKLDSELLVTHAFMAVIGDKHLSGYTDLNSVRVQKVKKHNSYIGYVDSNDKDSEEIVVIGP